MAHSNYCGRFAPSPTGPLHVGSLFTALASFLEARAQHGLWLLRIDDLDQPRNVPGAADAILRALDAFGLHWDQSVVYQSQHLTKYSEAAQQLFARNLLYRCDCSRKTLAERSNGETAEAVYPNYCRDKQIPSGQEFALRVKTEAVSIGFYDLLQGVIIENLASQHGDFIVKRKDHIYAYQLAVVIDDHAQQITHVVRGADLLDSTIKQLYLQRCLNLSAPQYMHVPVITGAAGAKLSKKAFAPAVTKHNSHLTLYKLLQLLQQEPPVALFGAPVQELLEWAIAHWDKHRLRNSRHIALTPIL